MWFARGAFGRIAFACLAIGLFGAAPAAAADKAMALGGYGASLEGAEHVHLGIGKSFVVDLPADASEVLVADPRIANAIVRSASKAYIIGVALGDTDIIFFDRAGNQIRALAVSVGRDMTPVRANLRSSIPGSQIQAQAVGDSVMLTGSVKSAGEAQTAVDIATTLVGSPDKVVNALAIEGRDQVLLKVTVAEMQRNVIKQLGIQWDANGIFGSTLVGFGSNPGFPVNGSTPGQVLQVLGGGTAGSSGVVRQIVGGNGIGVNASGSRGSLLANVQALEQSGLLRTLAEPTLTAISGEKADFLAGGEFPVPVGSDEDGITVSFKKYGVGLSFTPVVLSQGRISMQVSTEVSELTQEGAVAVGIGNNSVAVPGLRVRRANTTIELPSGGSLAIAGLLRDDVRQSLEGLPGLSNLPVLGALFRSRDYLRGQTELVVIVTPYIAKPVARDKLVRPDTNFEPASDTSAVLLGRLNRIYAPDGAAAPTPGSYRGPVGHIIK